MKSFKTLGLLFLAHLAWGSTAVTVYAPNGKYVQIAPSPSTSSNYTIVLPIGPGVGGQALTIQSVSGSTVTLAWITGGGGGGGGVWGSITGTLSNQNDLQTVLSSLGISTGTLSISTSSLKTSINAVATSTGALQVSINALGVSTGTLLASLNAIALSTGTLSVSTTSLQNQINAAVDSINGKVAYSSFSALSPITYNSGTGVFGATQISLSTGVTGNLGVTNLNGGTGATSSTFWRGDGTWVSSASFSGSASWGSIGGTLSNQTDLWNALSAIATSTTSLSASISSLGTSTGTLSTSTASLQIQITNLSSNVATSTNTLQSNINAVGAATGTIATTMFNLGVSTQALAVSTGTLYTLSNNKINFASITVSIPLTYNNTTGAFGLQLISLSTAVTGNLSVNNLNSGTGANSGTFWRGDGQWAAPAGGGGSSSLAVTTGTSAGFSTTISSPTGVFLVNGAQFILTAQGSATAYLLINTSSITAQGNFYSIANIATDTGTFKVRLDNLDTSTNTITTRLNAVGVSTAAIAVDTGTLATRLVSVGVSTAAIAADTGTINAKFTTVATDTTSLRTTLNSVATSTASIATSTASLQTQINSLNTSTATIALSTASLQVQINSLNTSTATIATSTASLQIQINGLNTSTATIAISTAALYTLVNGKVNYSSFTAAIPITYNNATGAFALQAISLSTAVTGNLPVTNLNGGSGASSSTFWRGDGTWVSSATFSGGGVWGSITGTLSSQTDLQTALNNVGVSTASLQTQINSLNTSTSTIATSTASLQIQINNLNTSTATIGTSTGTLYTLASAKVGYSSFTASIPITYNNGTGAFGLQLISLSTAVVGTLPAGNMVSTTAFTTSSNTFTSSTTFSAPVQISSSSVGLYLSSGAVAGFDGYILPAYVATSTVTWTNGNIQISSQTANTTYLFNAPPNSGSLTLMIFTGAGGFTATWPATVKWPSSTAPTITTGASKVDMVACKYLKMTGNYYCVWSGDER